VVIDGRGEVSGVLVLADQRQAEDVGVVFGLLCDVGQLVAGMRDLASRSCASFVCYCSRLMSRHRADDVDQDRIVLVGQAHVDAALVDLRPRGSSIGVATPTLA